MSGRCLLEPQLLMSYTRQRGVIIRVNQQREEEGFQQP